MNPSDFIYRTLRFSTPSILLEPIVAIFTGTIACILIYLWFAANFGLLADFPGPY